MEANKHGGKRAGAGRKPSEDGVKQSKTVRISQDVADIIKERFADTDNHRLRAWLKKLP